MSSPGSPRVSDRATCPSSDAEMDAGQAEKAEVSMVQAPSRRDRVRAATTQEIIDTARKLVVEHGPADVSLRAIAREMGMTAPALYRYFGSHEELLRHVVGSIFMDLADHVRVAINSAAELAGPDLDPSEIMEIKLIAGTRAFRDWAL